MFVYDDGGRGKAIDNPGSATRKSVAADLRLAIELLEAL